MVTTKGKGVVEGGGATYMVTEVDLTMGGGYTMNILIMYHSNVHLKPI